MIVTDLSNSFNPYPKPCKKEKEKPKSIKQKSNKLAKMERQRVSIIQEKEGICFLCGKHIKTDTHEAFGGSNRQKSMEYGLIFYLCRDCHKKADLETKVRNYLHKIAKVAFIKKYGKEKFLKEFGKKYIKKEKINEK